MEILEKIYYCSWAFSACVAFMCMAVAPVRAEPRTDNDSIIKDCEGDNASAKKILIAYDTIHGSTAEVAERIGDALCAGGLRVELRLASGVDSVDEYDGIIIASAIYKFTWLPGAKGFLKRFSEELSQKPSAVFIVCSAMSADTPDTRAASKKMFVDPILRKCPELNPVSVGLFGGAVNFKTEQYTLFEKVVLRILGAVLHFKDQADWRNWDTIDAWAAEVGDAMK